MRSRTRTGAVVYARDEHGVSYAIEVIDTDSWDDRFLVPPAAAEADVRVIRLHATTPGRHAPEPQTTGFQALESLPRWLHVERLRGRVAEDAAVYSAGTGGVDGAAASQYAVARRLWSWSPHHRAPAPALAEFIATGAAAVLHPQPVPTETRRQLDIVIAFARDRAGPLGVLARLRDQTQHVDRTQSGETTTPGQFQPGEPALERWLQQAFGEPDRFADAILIERIADLGSTGGTGTPGATEVAETLRFLRDAAIDEQAPAYLELAIDRRALLEQASPWRYIEGAPFGGALAAAHAWCVRYRLAYEAHYHAAVRDATLLRADLNAARSTAEALTRLDAITALGPPAGAAAVREYHEASASVEALPADPDPERARTAGITLGTRPAQFYRAWAAIEAVRAAFELQRKQLAARTAHLVLSRQNVPALDRLLQAIVASDLDGIDRVLDDRLAALIAELLEEGVQ